MLKTRTLAVAENSRAILVQCRLLFVSVTSLRSQWR